MRLHELENLIGFDVIEHILKSDSHQERIANIYYYAWVYRLTENDVNQIIAYFNALDKEK